MVVIESFFPGMDPMPDYSNYRTILFLWAKFKMALDFYELSMYLVGIQLAL